MKKLIVILFVVFVQNVFAQYDKTNSSNPTNSAQPSKNDQIKFGDRSSIPPQKLYLGLNTGINNPRGIIGFDLEYALRQVSLSVGLGTSSWGRKFAFEAKKYFNTYQSGWAVSVQLTHSVGFSNYQVDSHDNSSGAVNGTAKIDLLPIQTLGLMGYHYWRLGKRNNRFHLAFGYSGAFQSQKINFISGHALSDTDNKVYNLISPGGLILALGFDFGL